MKGRSKFLWNACRPARKNRCTYFGDASIPKRFMTNNVKIAFTTIALVVFHFVLFAQKPNYTGTWILNFEKSRLEHQPPGLISTVFVIKQDENNFFLTRYHIFDKKKKKISFKMIANGKMKRVKILFKGKLEWKENNLVSTLWRKNFMNTVTYKPGQNEEEFIADEVFKSRYQSHHNIWVFDREK
jgi:hypothetical protein